MNLAYNLKKYRKKKKISQRQLAEAINKSKSTIEKYELGVIKKISIHTLISISRALDVSLNDLCGLNNQDLTNSNLETSQITSKHIPEDINIGRNLRKYRKKKKMTQQQLADAINKSKSTIEKYENSSTKSIELNTLISICTVLDVSLDTIICSIDEETQTTVNSNLNNFTLNKREPLIVDRDILFFAFRYSLGRMTYAPYTVVSAIKDNINNICSGDIERYIKEIRECENYGMDFDKEHWLNFAKYLEEILHNRQQYLTTQAQH